MPTPTEKPLDFRIGSDPEFLLFHGSRALDASHIIVSFFKQHNRQGGSNGYPVGNHGNVGWDGASSTGEFRPSAADTPQKAVRNLGALIAALHKHIPLVDYTTLSIGAPIGGHVHLELPERLRGTGNTVIKERDKITKMLATFCMPIFASDHRISATARVASGSYGKADDVRYEAKGSSWTAEVRGLSAEWTTTPHVAEATLSYLAVIWNEIIKHTDDLYKQPSIFHNRAHIQAAHQMILSDFKLIERGLLRGIHKLVKKFELYPQYQKEVDFILHPRLVMKEKEKHGWNLGDGWKMGQSKKPTKRALLGKNKAHNELKNIDAEVIRDGFHTIYNDDFKVQMFADEITLRKAGLNWKLENEYFLYGLKKGIEGFNAYNDATKRFYAVPTNTPKNESAEVAVRMSARGRTNLQPSLRIDPKTGKIRNPQKNSVIAIGLPYDIRAKGDVRPLIKLIWDIENKHLIPKDILAFPEPEIPANLKKNEIESTTIQQAKIEIDREITEQLDAAIQDFTESLDTDPEETGEEADEL